MAHTSRDIQHLRAGLESSHAAAYSKPTPSGPSSYLLFLGGLGLAAAGVLLMQPPAAIEHADWIATKLSRLGVQGFPLVASGMIVFCLGLVMRFQAKTARALSTGNDPGESLELARLAEEFGQLRGALGNVQTELLANKQRQDSMLESIHSVTAKDDDSESHSNAMFRLAASLDQLGARIEERLKHQSASFDTRFADISNSVVRAQQEITEAVDNVEMAVAQQAAERAIELASSQVQAAGYEAPLGDLPNHEDVPFHEPNEYSDDLGYQEAAPVAQHDEELHIMVELEEDEAPAPLPNDSPLGILDTLDDFGSLVERGGPQPE